jgi:ketosteroid isomerase-like protein
MQTSQVVLERLQQAQNSHDLEAFVACFAPDYQSAQPIHPDRAFQGAEQVRKNWTTIFQDVPDFRAELLRLAVDGDIVWAEWHWFGTKRDGAQFAVRGVTIMSVQADQITWGRLYMEPVQEPGAG